MDNDWIKASIIHCTLNTFHEAQWTVICFIFLLFLQNDNFHKNRVQEVAVIYVIDNRVVGSNSYIPRPQRYFARPSSNITYSLEKNRNPSHSNLKKPIIISINFIDSKLTTEAMYLLTCQKGIWVRLDVPKGRLSCGLRHCRQMPNRWRLALLWWLASGYCNLPVSYLLFWAAFPTFSLNLIVYNAGRLGFSLDWHITMYL